MKITELTVKNFKTIRDLELDLPDGIIGIVGGNGQGKSTILTAIAYALYGPTVVETGTADIVTWGEKKSTVTIKFELDQHKYELQRSQAGPGGTAVLIREDQVLANSIAAVNDEIERLLGVDRVGFLASVFSAQEDLLGIGSLQPAKRTSTILRLLGIDQIDSGIKWVNERVREFNGTLDLMRRNVEQIPDLDVAGTKKEIAALTKDRDAMITAFEQAVEASGAAYQRRDDLKEAYDNWLRYSSKLDALNYQLREAKSDVARYEAALETKPTPPARPANYIEPSEYQRRSTTYDAKFSEIERALNSTVCPTCNRPFDDAEQKKQHLAAERKKLSEESDWLRTHYDAAKDSDRYKSEQQRYEMVLLPNYNRAEAQLHEAISKLADLQERIDALEVWPDVTEEYKAVAKEADDKNVIVQDYTARLGEANLRIRMLETEIEKYGALSKSREEQVEKIKAYEREVVDYATTSAQLKSFKSSMVSGIIPYLEEKASAFVSDMTDGEYTELSLTSQYDIQFRNSLGELKSFGNLSGGEKDVFALALRLAIADLRASAIGMLVLDEVFESLDPDRQEATWLLLEKLASRYDQVFIVTHVPMFKDRAPFTVNL